MLNKKLFFLALSTVSGVWCKFRLEIKIYLQKTRETPVVQIFSWSFAAINFGRRFSEKKNVETPTWGM